jgi:hypothetical protein
VHETVAKDALMHVQLRHTEQGGQVQSRGHQHPVTISDVRVAHILASFIHQDRDGNRDTTIRSEHIYMLAEAISRALGRAGPEEVVVVQAFWRQRRMGIFNVDHVTSFQVYMRHDDLVFEFFDVATAMRGSTGRGGDDYVVPEVSVATERFELIAGEAQTRRGTNGLAVDWRNAYYRRPVSLSTRKGRTRRRTVIMEMPAIAEEPIEAAVPDPDPDLLTDAQLRALDQLEAARLAGYVSEGEYRRRKRLIRSNQLQEAGYGTVQP